MKLAGADASLWVYRAMLRTSGVPALAASADDAFRSAPPEAPPVTLWAPGETLAVLLLSSGFFCATVFRVCTVAGVVGASPQLVLHKRCARYTTRRKQGGSQSAHDASRGSAANSAGAQLRRHGEAQLEADVREVMCDASVWAPALRACRRIFFAAPRRATQALFVDGGALVRGDLRLHRVPLATGRPSVAEATRVAETLMAHRPADLAAALSAAAAQAGAREAAAAAVAASRRDRAAAQAASQAAAAQAAAELADANATGTVAPNEGHRRPRGRRRGPKKYPAGETEERDDDGGLEEEEGKVDNPEAEAEEAALLASAAAAAADDRAAAGRAADAVTALRASYSEAECLADMLAARCRVPHAIMARCLGLNKAAEALVLAEENPRAGTITGGGKRGKRGKSGGGRREAADPISLARSCIAAARDLAASALAIVAEGASPAQALTAIGLDSLGAASLVAGAGALVDWAAAEAGIAADAERSRSRAVAGSDDDDAAVNVLVGTQTARKTQASAGAGGSGTKLAARAASIPSLPPQMPPPQLAPELPLSPRELMRRAALARAQAAVSAVQPTHQLR